MPDSHIQKVRTLDELVQGLSSAGFVISQRYHGALSALALEKDVEILSQCDGDKLSTLQNLNTVNVSLVRVAEHALRTALKIE